MLVFLSSLCMQIRFDQNLRNMKGCYVEHRMYGRITKSLTFVTNKEHVAGPTGVTDTHFEARGIGQIVDGFGTCTQNSIKSIGAYKKRE